MIYYHKHEHLPKLCWEIGLKRRPYDGSSPQHRCDYVHEHDHDHDHYTNTPDRRNDKINLYNSFKQVSVIFFVSVKIFMINLTKSSIASR